MKKSSNKKEISIYSVLMIILIIIVFVLRFWRLNSPDSFIFDEIYYPKWALDYLHGATPYDVHPPLVKLFIAFSEKIMGYNVFSARFFSALFGSLSVVLTYLLANKIFKNKLAAIFGATLVAFDGLFYVMSRTAIMEIYVVFFMILSVLLYWMFLESKKRKLLWLVLTGLALGMAISCKWTNFSIWALVIFWTILFWRNINQDLNKKLPIYFILFLGILPVLVYALSFVIWYHGINNFMADIVSWHKNAFSFHKNLHDPHPYASEWWSWPLLFRPVWFYYQVRDDLVYGIIALGNPLIWWPALEAFFWGIWYFYETKNKQILFCILGFIFNLVPWIFISRIKFNYYFLPTLFFEILIFAYMMSLNWKKYKILITLYFVLVVISFLFFYPIMSDWPMTHYYHRLHLWFKNWI